MCSTQVHTASRPLRGVQSLGQGGATASATIALEADTARLSRQKIYFVAAQKDPTGCKRSAAKKRRFIFLWALRVRGGDNTPFSFAQTRDSKKLENIREKKNLRG